MARPNAGTKGVPRLDRENQILDVASAQFGAHGYAGTSVAAVAKQVYLATDTTRLMKEAGLTPPTTTTKSFSVMGKAFDPAKPEAYVNSFKIRRS